MNNNYTTATQLFEQGNEKDAYAAFLAIVELSTQQLHQAKFVHQTIVAPPFHYQDSITLLRSSIDQIEKIASFQKKTLPGAIDTPPKTKSPPPPVPPKPLTTLQKPIIPPKPKKMIPTTVASKRIRASSVSFADDNTLTKTMILEERSGSGSSNVKVVVDDDDDDDDDDIIIDFFNKLKRPSTTINNENSNRLPKLRARSQSWVVQSTPKRDSIDVLSETIVDPTNLVPAQTNTGDSLALPNISLADNYIPKIPAPPLLATHRRLQQRINELENDLKQCREGDELQKSERSHKVSSAKQTLEKVRNLYMSAMTIPSILQFSPHLIAYQLTLMESSIFRGIPRDAHLSHSAKTPHKRVAASTDFFNFITRSIEHSILLPQEASQRAEIILRWIKIATKLLSLNNYQTLKAVVSALGTPPIQRLRRTWECIPKKRMVRLDFLSSLMSEADNYRKYREHMGLEKKKIWIKPVVPFLGIFIHDLTYLYAAAKGNSQDARVQDVLNGIQLFQRAPEYPQQPPASLMASKKHLLTNALHFGSSSTKNHNNRMTTAALMGEDQRQETEVELEQQLIVQFLLMRPWMTEKTIDSLSNLREPSKPRSISSPTSVSTSLHVSNSTSTGLIGLSNTASHMGTPNNNNGNGSITTVGSGLPSSSVLFSSNSFNLNSSSSVSLLGSASTFMRFSSSSSSSSNSSNNNSSHHQTGLADSPAVIDSNQQNHIGEENKRSLAGMWPFRKNSDMNKTSATIASDAIAPFTATPHEQVWSEEEEEEEDDEEEDIAVQAVPRRRLNNTNNNKGGARPSTINFGKRHSRSISLPSKSILITDLYNTSK